MTHQGMFIISIQTVKNGYICMYKLKMDSKTKCIVRLPASLHKVMISMVLYLLHRPIYSIQCNSNKRLQLKSFNYGMTNIFNYIFICKCKFDSTCTFLQHELEKSKSFVMLQLFNIISYLKNNNRPIYKKLVQTFIKTKIFK